MSNNIIVLSSDNEGDNPIDPWVSYSRKADNYTVQKNHVSPNSLRNNDPFQIGLRYPTPLMVTPFKEDRVHNNDMLNLGGGINTTSPTVY